MSSNTQKSFDTQALVVGSVNGAVPVRGTQSFVHTLSACWKRPSLTALEVGWRWVFGIPAGALVVYEGLRALHGTPVNVGALQRMSVLDPMGAATTLTTMFSGVLPPLLHLAAWLGPLLLVVWVIVSSIGRTAVLRRADGKLHRRLGAVMVLQATRMIALVGSFAVWFELMRKAAQVALDAPIAAGHEPNMVLYCTLAIVMTLGLFMLWAVVSWTLSVAPLLAMLLNRGAGASLAGAFRLGPVRSKLAEINLVMGIVKIALIVLAMVFSSCPLPFEAIATPSFMLRWYVVVSILFFVASDFFHVVRLVAYLELWKAYNKTGPEA